MREVICSRSLRGSFQFSRKQGGKYGGGFEIERQTDDGLRGGDFERSGKAAEIEQGRPAATPKIVRAYVKRLRDKLADEADRPALIVNERGVGYRMPRPGDR